MKYTDHGRPNITRAFDLSHLPKSATNPALWLNASQRPNQNCGDDNDKENSQSVIGGPLSLTLPLSKEIPWPYNRPFPFHRLVLRSAQRNFPFSAGVVVIKSDGVGNLKVAVDFAIEAGCIAGTNKL
jgi:hypothetical protein